MSGNPRSPLIRALASEASLSNLEAEDAPQVLAELSAIAMALSAKLASRPDRGADATKAGEVACSRWLSPDEAAELANVPRRVIYGWSRRTDWRNFTHRLSRKVLRVEEQGFRLWLNRQASR